MGRSGYEAKAFGHTLSLNNLLTSIHICETFQKFCTSDWLICHSPRNNESSQSILVCSMLPVMTLYQIFSSHCTDARCLHGRNLVALLATEVHNDDLRD